MRKISPKYIRDVLGGAAGQARDFVREHRRGLAGGAAGGAALGAIGLGRLGTFNGALEALSPVFARGRMLSGVADRVEESENPLGLGPENGGRQG